MERLKPSWRRRVAPDPNGVFSDITNICQAQREAGRLESSSEDEEEESEEESEEEGVEDCIITSR